MDKILDLGFVRVDMVQENVYKILYSDGVTINLSQAIEFNDSFHKLVSSKSIVTILDMTKNKLDYENDAQQYMAKNASMAKRIKANAILLENLGPRILARWYIRFHKPIHPTKIFSNQKDALTWVKTHLPA